MKIDQNIRGDLGTRLRHLRKQNSWTLSQVSEKTGLAISTLSKVENNQTSLTYDNLLKLSEGVGLHISELFGAQNMTIKNGRRAVTKRGAARPQITRNYDYHYHSTEIRETAMVPMLVTVKSRSLEDFGDLLRHRGEEFIYVVEGLVDIHTDYYEPLRLEVGESIYLDSAMGHGVVTVGEKDAKVLCICTDPIR